MKSLGLPASSLARIISNHQPSAFCQHASTTLFWRTSMTQTMGPISNDAAPLTPGPASDGGGGGSSGIDGSVAIAVSTRQRTGAASSSSSGNAAAAAATIPSSSTSTPMQQKQKNPPSTTPLQDRNDDDDDEDDERKAKRKGSKKKRRPPPSLSLTLNRASNACRSCLVSGGLKKTISVLMALLALGLLADFIFTPPDQRLIQPRRIKLFLIWVQSNPIKGLLAYVLVYALMVVLLLPGTPLTIGSGYIYKMAYGWGAGVTIGSIFSTLGSLLGSVLCFCLGRYLMKETVRQWVRKSPLFGAIDDAVGKNGFKIMALLYLSPILPLGPVSYMCGTTSMKLAHFAAAKVACVPLMIFYVFLGASAGTLVHKGGGKKGGAGGGGGGGQEKGAVAALDENSDQLDHLVEGESTGMIIFAILLSAASMALISHFVKRELMKVLNQQKAESEVKDLSVLLGSADDEHGGIEMTSSSAPENNNNKEIGDAGQRKKKNARQRRQFNVRGGESDQFNDDGLTEQGNRGKDV